MQGLSGCANVQLLPAQDDDWIPWFIDVLVSDRDSLGAFLKSHSVQTRITYPALAAGEFPNTQRISQKGLFLPTHFLLTDSEIDYICHLIRLWDTVTTTKEVALE